MISVICLFILPIFLIPTYVCGGISRTSIEVTLAHWTLQTKIMWNSYIWHRVTPPSIVELYFSPSHPPSVGCFGIGSWDLALPWLPLMHTKKVGGWSLAHSLSPVNADGCFCWRMGRVYVQCQWIFMCLKHICGGRLLRIWEQEFDS